MWNLRNSETGVGKCCAEWDTILAYVREAPLGALPLYGIAPDRLEKAYYLADGSEMTRGEAWNTVLFQDVAFVALGANPVFTYPLPDQIDTVLKIKMKKTEDKK